MCIFKIGHAESQHGRKVLIRPNGVDLIVRTRRSDKRRRNVAGNGGRDTIAGERRGTGIDDADKVGARGNPRQRISRSAVLFVEVVIQGCGCRGQFGARGKPHDADLVWVEMEVFRVRSHQADGLLCVVDLVGTRVISIAAQPVPQDDGVDTVVIEEGNEICALGSNVQEVMATARHDDHSSARIEPSLYGVHLDRRVVYVDDAVDSARYRLAHVVLFGLTDFLLIEKRRAGRVERHDHSPGQDGLRNIGRISRWVLCSTNGHYKERQEYGFLFGHASQSCPGNT
jgi:hypothetical protein